MGLFRKITSLGTMGAVDFRSDKERTAAYAKGSRKELKRQTAMMREQQRQLPPPVYVPPGWYPDPQGQPLLRWWDGVQWTPAARQ